MNETAVLFYGMGLFAEDAFPGATSEEHLKKLITEANEAIKDTGDIKEFADCLLCLFGAVYRSGFTYEKLLTAAKDKLQINVLRKWEKQADGTYQHV